MTTALGWMLLHSLWQGVMLWLCVKIVARIFQNRSAQFQYALYLGALLCFFGAAVLTFFQHVSFTAFFEGKEKISLQTLAHFPKFSHFSFAEITQEAIWQAKMEAFFPLLIPVWLMGIAFFALKLALSYLQLFYIQRNAIKIENWEQRTEIWKQRLGIRQHIQLKFSDKIDTPFMMGCIKPLILIPLGLLSQLPPEQIESIILHELAHIRRYDYWVNIFQCVVETLFFFHPCIHLISLKIRELREIACDEKVLSLQQKPLIYAKALTALEQYRLRSYAPALAAADNQLQLFNRIKRMMETQNRPTYTKGSRFIALTLIGLAFGTVYGISSPSVQKQVPKVVATAQKVWKEVCDFSAELPQSIAKAPALLLETKDQNTTQNEAKQETGLFVSQMASITPPDTLTSDSVIIDDATGKIQVFKGGKMIREITSTQPQFPTRVMTPPLPSLAPTPNGFSKMIIIDSNKKGGEDEQVRIEIKNGKDGKVEVYEGEAALKKLAEMEVERGGNSTKSIEVWTDEDGNTYKTEKNIVISPKGLQGNAWVVAPEGRFYQFDSEDFKWTDSMGKHFEFYMDSLGDAANQHYEFHFPDGAAFDAERLKEQQREMRRQMKDMRNQQVIILKEGREMQKHHREMLKHNRDMQKHNRDMQKHNREMEEHDRQLRNLDGLRYPMAPLPPIPPLPPLAPMPPLPPTDFEVINGEGPDLKTMLIERGYLKEGESFTFKLNKKGAFLNGKRLPDDIAEELRGENADNEIIIKSQGKTK